MKVILDTNVIIAAFATHGLCYLVFETVIAQHELVLGPSLVKEVKKNLEKKVKMPSERIAEILAFLESHSTPGNDSIIVGLHCRDADDLKVLSLAVHTESEVIVTGDQDLLTLGSVKTTAILSPRDFWTRLQNHILPTP